MIIFALDTTQIIFIIVAIVVVIVAIGLALFFPLRKRYIKKQFKDHYYHKIYSIAFNQDYYLINDFLFKVNESVVAGVDHILFADKYIYLINDYYYDGDLTGKCDDQSLIFINEKGKKYYTDNPILLSEKILLRLSAVTGIDKSLFIGVVLINDKCRCGIEQESKQVYMIQRRKLSKLVRAIESREVARLKPDQLAQAVKAIDKLNRRKKNR